VTKFLISAVVIVMMAIVGGAYVATDWVPVPSRKDVWTPANAQVLYTAQTAGSPKAYVFWYDAGAFGYTIRILSLGTPTHEGALMQSDYMNGIRWTAPDTLVVELWKNDYHMMNERADIVVVPHVTPE